MNEGIVPDSAGKLTSRQREFLDSLKHLYEVRGQAVSYKDVASEMKVSKWTAYDILHDLYQRGFLRLEHAVTSGKGRSRILYVPEWNTLSTTSKAGDDGTTELATLKWLRQKVVQYAKYSVSDAIRMAAQDVMSGQNPFRTVLYACVLLILFSSAFKMDFEQLVHFRGFMTSALSAGTVLGVLIEFMFSLMCDEKWLQEHLELPSESVKAFAECEQSCRKSLVRLSEREQKLMVSVIRQAVMP
ncbi:MAG: hypothetical protein ABFD13_02480 [Candidatus Cryosericum sp.]|nr:hypothetical protein [bacterium]